MIARSRPRVSVGYLGATPDEVWAVIKAAWQQPFAIQSNYARAQSIPVALAASLGWISTIAPDGQYFMRSWHVTKEGLTALEHSDAYGPKRD